MNTEIKEGSRKVTALRETRTWYMVFFLVYILGEYFTDLNAGVVMVIAGSLGLGHATMNAANAMEHRAKKNAEVS